MPSAIASHESTDMAEIEARLRLLTPGELWSRFEECRRGIARYIAEAAVCIKLLEEAHEDLSGIRYRREWLRVADGLTLPELMEMFLESDSRNRGRLALLPISEQKRIVADPMVPLVVPKPGGGFTNQKVDLRTASKEVLEIVVSGDGVRTAEEQIAHIGRQKASTAARAATVNDEPVSEPLAHSMTIRLTAGELESLRLHAALAGVSNADMIRRFLVRAKAFNRPKT